LGHIIFPENQGAQVPCADAFGMVIPGVLPSWLTPLAAITALITSLSFWACSKDFKITIPHPSPRPYPVPRLSKENDLPSFENNLNFLKPQYDYNVVSEIERERKAYLDFAIDTQYSGSIFRWHPPTIANSDSPLCKLLQA
jgi:hypothetical protein